MEDEFVIAIDIGTSRCKVAVTDCNLKIVAEAYYEYPLEYLDENHIEQDAEVWWDTVKLLLKEIGKKVNLKKAIALAFTSQNITFVPVDESGSTLRKAISWLDTRTQIQRDEILALRDSFYFYQRTGKIVNSGYVLPKLLWLKSYENEIYESTFKILMTADFLNFKLTGDFYTNHSLANGTLLYNLNSHDWDADIINDFNINAQKLPEILWPGQESGRLKLSVANELGLNPKLKIIMGDQDQKCAAMGAGITEGITCIPVGTAGGVCAISKELKIDRNIRIPIFPFLNEKMWFFEAVIPCAGATVKWLKGIIDDASTILHENGGEKYEVDYSTFDRCVENSSIGSKGVRFFPHLAGVVVPTSPYFIPEQRGIFSGISLNTRLNDMVRAVYEGICYQIKYSFNNVVAMAGEQEKIIIYGGMAKSFQFSQMLSDILNRKIVSLGGIDPTLLGAAAIAAYGSGKYKSIEKAYMSIRNTSSDFNPNPHRASEYHKYYTDYINRQKSILKME